MNVWRSDGMLVGKFRIDGTGNCHWVAYDENGDVVLTGSDRSCTPTAAELAEWGTVAKQVATTMAGKWHLFDADLYIRFGNLPKNERSKNYRTGEYEAGVSCFRSTVNLLTGAYELTGDGDAHAAIAASLGEYGHVALLITGQRVGTGGDGEPVVRNVNTLAHLRYDETLGGYVEL